MAALDLGVLLYIAIASSCLIISVLGNACIIIVIYKNKHMRTVTNMFISNLAASDFLMGGILLPQNIHDISHTEEYDEGVILCKVVTALPIICITCSIYSLVMMAVERYRAICTTSGSMSKRTCKILCAACWILAIAVSMPTMLEYSVFYVEDPDKRAAIDAAIASYTNATLLNDTSVTPPNELATNLSGRCGNTLGGTFGLVNGVFLFLVAYMVPLIMIIVSYGKVAGFIISQTRQQEATKSEGSAKTNFSVSKNKVRIIKLLVIVAVLFAASWCPYFILLLMAKITGKDDTGAASGPLNLIKLSLSIFSVNYNVYLYNIYTASFRKAFKQLLCPWYAKKEEVVMEGQTAHNKSVVVPETEEE